MGNKFKDAIENILISADIKINGNNPWDIKVYNDEFYQRVLAHGSLGLGESYMDDWWNCEALDQLIDKIFRAKLDEKIKKNWGTIFESLKAKLLNLQSKLRLQKVIKQSYNLSAELYMAFLDPYNQYTCGYFKNTEDLNSAQETKLELICKKLNISPGDKVLDIGCGWGGFAKFAAERFGSHVTGITISDKQLIYAQNYTRTLPVRIIKQDYRDLEGKYDKILVCGMIEHVGYKNYRSFFTVVHRCLKDEGIFLLHTIGANKSTTHSNPWIDKYIFPNVVVPSIAQIGKAIEGLFVMEDWHNFAPDYDKTLMLWYKNFENAWSKLKNDYDERFHRMWKFYLLTEAAAFRSRVNQLWQIVMTKPGVKQPSCRII